MLGLVVSGACTASILPLACSSDSSSKKTPTKYVPPSGGDAGEAGETGNQGGSSGRGGATGGGGTTPIAGSSSGGEAGVSTGGSGGEAGAQSEGGEGGESGAPNLCPSGFGNCDTSSPDCETPLNLVTSCGACGTSCDGTHATVTCTDAKCAITTCAANYGDCDNDPVTGCETAINTDKNCGTCGRDCTSIGSTCGGGECAGVTLLATGGSGYQSAFVAGDSLYVMNTGSMPPGNYSTTRVPLNGSATTILTNNEGGGPGPGVLNADASFIYWSISGSPPSVLKKAVTAAAGDLNTVVFHPLYAPRYMAIVGSAYYWTAAASATSAMIYSRSTTAAATDAGTAIVTTDQGWVTSFRATTDRLYFVHRPASTTTLSYVPFSGGTPVDVPDAVVADSAPLWSIGNTLYFVRNVGTAPENGVYRYTTGDTTVTQLTQANDVTNMIGDANFVYYTVTFADSTIYRAPAVGAAKQGIGIASSFRGAFAGQDSTLLYTISSWGSDGPVKKYLK